MTNLLKQAINADDGDCAAKLIQKKMPRKATRRERGYAN
jgi:hypothetical protein